jgi:hypothetical protein
MTEVTHVEDDEALYRSVPPDGVEKGLVVLHADGSLDHFSSQAFSDRSHRMSVDRAMMRDNQPERTCKQPNAGVAQVITGDVRHIGPLAVSDSHGAKVGDAQVDVEHRPIENDPDEPDNPAHAEIFVDPDSTSRYRRVIEKLALLATAQGWVLEPS